ncbi:tRNA(Arg) A34 adenosine deaminase TadA [Luteimonas sp. J16]|jgi:tRNA(Arg) A34 adenosine deaminase TadA|uniref:nucleoside deaminase n=1 Tax=unclassified Luteimonas TaxID=2629088 RepID=UPI00047D6D01|nr:MULTISPECIES: nucleoside deaminase [unclassified Luteimonas]TWG92990.1 tRNA(Arg) A34 adenosine deaminase TadA [Luteimonas sp. J16]
MLPATVQLDLPEWAHGVVDPARTWPGDEAKVRLAIDLSRRNIEAQSGGPFGAAVFDADDRLVAIGVNRVLPQHCSVAHAETMALMLAQQHLGRARLNRDLDGLPVGRYVLATSAQPCCQCYGATVWAGIDRLLIGARSADVEALTEFDEGPLPADWPGELERRGIEVVRDIAREAACEVLAAYGSSGARHY